MKIVKVYDNKLKKENLVKEKILESRVIAKKFLDVASENQLIKELLSQLKELYKITTDDKREITKFDSKLNKIKKVYDDINKINEETKSVLQKRKETLSILKKKEKKAKKILKELISLQRKKTKTISPENDEYYY